MHRNLLENQGKGIGWFIWNGTNLDFDSDANYPVVVDNATFKLRGKGAYYGASIVCRF